MRIDFSDKVDILQLLEEIDSFLLTIISEPRAYLTRAGEALLLNDANKLDVRVNKTIDEYDEHDL